MKALLTSLSIAAALGISGSALAGPSDGTPRRFQKAFDRLHETENRYESKSHLITEGRGEAVSYRWERKLKWVAGHRYRRSVLVRVPVE